MSNSHRIHAGKSEAFEKDTDQPGNDRHYGRQVVLAGVGINLALGFLYAWSVISKKIPDSWQWSEADRVLPYSIACLGISLPMVFTGWFQDKCGPRMAATIGGILAGSGIILASLTQSLAGYALGFGALFGVGTSFAYAAVTPTAVKWFSPAKTGVVTGIVVGGYGLATLYAAPLAELLINAHGISNTLLAVGIVFFLGIVGFSQLLVLPKTPSRSEKKGNPDSCDDFSPREIVRTWQFYVIWFAYACASGAGLMVISKLAIIADFQAGLKLGFVLVACLGLGNGGGRILTGAISDRIGRKATLLICFATQACLIFLLSKSKGPEYGTLPVFMALSTLIGMNYGANLSLYPSITKDYYGLKNFGANFGLIHSAWGVGGFALSFLAGYTFDMMHSFILAYKCAIVLLLFAFVLTVFIKAPGRREQSMIARGLGKTERGD
ncbi:OFA family MFS transporter [Termitidicoccus mucosus]|uniref:Major facilitator superfamily (MFS) profile domain-containing protein n=1 Tax=Termitidicoccus mucosus TaxID=1184151 RepID=A0A178IMD3_9BACT|nr:hypothetical protein AW736_05380 [Opitutaceae bacterium TSB47]